ncbi:PREDICTED: uncharacterized protein LOC106331665 isoform X1 [Brassica oleracea var. oleracea]|uniref:uncharacterized protein LOC106331665 isoform X1 n=1 Tax=Brassica oleracea var. oleracea TaxID=109376 RepID=UPI0006A6DBD7|nr:PREDICTED: uncharacterized protein LOC106331665 isoform X1 [Brassica oleracea var. oleracea]
MEEGTSSGSRRTRSQVAPEWTLKDCLILVNEIAAVESDCSNALSSFQKWTMISDNCNALDVHRTFNQCRRKWDSLVSDYSQIKKWESQERGSVHSYWSLSVEKRRKLNLPGNVDNELFQAINAVVMIQENKDGSEPDSDSDPDAQEDFDVVDVTAELAFAGSKRSRQRTMVVMKENPPHKRKTEEEPRRKNIQEQRAKATHQKKKTMEVKKKPVVEISTDEEEEEAMSIEEEVKALEAKLGEKTDIIHAIVGRNLAKGSETEDGVGIEDKLKFVRQQGDELIACLSEIANTLDRLREVPQEI